MEGKFGEGNAGENARWIVANEPCKVCGEKANSTLDFDLIGELEQVPVCAAPACINAIRNSALADMQRRGQVDQYNTFSMNGLGRC